MIESHHSQSREQSQEAGQASQATQPVKPHCQSNETAGQAKPPVSYVLEVGV